MKTLKAKDIEQLENTSMAGSLAALAADGFAADNAMSTASGAVCCAGGTICTVGVTCFTNCLTQSV